MMTGLPVQIRGFQIDDCVLKCNFNLWNWGPKLGIVDLTPPNISLWLLLDLLMMTGRPTSYMIINYIPGPRSLRSPPPHLWYFGRHHVRLRQRFEARHDLTNFFLHIKINVFNYPFFKKRSNWYHALVEITIKTKFYWEQSNNLSIYIGYPKINISF